MSEIIDAEFVVMGTAKRRSIVRNFVKVVWQPLTGSLTTLIAVWLYQSWSTPPWLTRQLAVGEIIVCTVIASSLLAVRDINRRRNKVHTRLSQQFTGNSHQGASMR